jgi:hypothetical protein
MSFKSFWKHVIFGYEDDDPELVAARKKYGIETGEDDSEEKKEIMEYNAWDELRDMRMQFFLGRWVTRKFRPVGEEKVKKQLEELEKKRQEEEAVKEAEKEGE